MPRRVPFVCRLFALLVAITVTPRAEAAITEVIDYQGYLTLSNGVPVSGVQSITVALYAQVSGGTALWSQTSNLTVTNGRFSMLLDGRPSAGNPFPAALFQRTLWAGIKIGADPEMTPRTLLAAAPYAFKSADSDTVGGFTAEQLAGAQPATYMGASTASIGGAQGHLAMNAACNSTYPGSRMCTSEEILSQPGPITITKAQHVHPVIVTSFGTTEVIDYSGNKATWSLMLCGSSNRAWQSSGSAATGLGIVPASSNRLTLIDCGDQNTAAVACCKDD